MKKKILLGCSLLAATLSPSVFAGGFYVGPMVFVQKISASHSSFTGAHPRISLGYGNVIEGYYLAGEIFASPFIATLSNSVNTNGVSAKIKNSFGASFIPGIMLDEKWIAYLRLGVVSSKFTGPNVTKAGAQAGLGLQTSLASNWDLRGEYIYTVYKSVSGLGTPRSNELGVGATYRFG